MQSEAIVDRLNDTHAFGPYSLVNSMSSRLVDSWRIPPTARFLLPTSVDLISNANTVIVETYKEGRCHW